jgi:hypothetical protein
LLKDCTLEIPYFCFFVAVNNNNLDIVDILLGDGRVDPCFDDNLALITAIHKQHKEIVLRLIQDPRVIDHLRTSTSEISILISSKVLAFWNIDDNTFSDWTMIDVPVDKGWWDTILSYLY